MKYSNEQLKKIHVQQMGQFACGLACLSAITNYHQGSVTQEKLREISGTTLNGTSLLGLYHAAEKIGFNAKGLKGDLEHLKLEDQPAILHVILDGNQEHFVVYYGYRDNHFIIGDPAVGIKSYSDEALGAIWKSKALLCLEPSKTEFSTSKDENNGQWMWFKGLIKDDINILIVSAVIGFAMAILGLSMAIFSQKLIDEFLPNNETQKIVIGFSTLLVLLIAQAVLGLIRGIFMAQQGKDLNVRILKSFLEKMIALPISYFKGYSTGDLIARMNDSMRIRNTVAHVTGNVLISILVVVISTVYVFVVSIPIGLVSLSSIIAFILQAWKYHANILVSQREVMAAHSMNESLYVDSLTGISTIKSFGKEGVFSDRINMVYNEYQAKGLNLSLLANRFGFATQFVVGIYLTLIFAAGVWYVVQDQLLLGQLMALVAVSGSMVPSLAGLMSANIQIQEAKVAFNRMYELTSLESEDIDNLTNTELKENQEIGLEIQDVSFRFPGRQPVLKKINLTLNKGEMITLFGQVGSGKSTLVDLIQGHLEPEDGVIRMAGISQGLWSQQMLEKEISVVAQMEKIFNTTVLDNIALSNNNDDALKAIKFFEETVFSKFFEDLPQGYLTLCGEDGKNLSGGQKQIVSIARAVYRQPSFLILDESTSAMDYETEFKIIEYLKTVIGQSKMGVLLVTHRLGLAQLTDRIYLLGRGIIEHSGTHYDLVKNNNEYGQGYANLTNN